MISANAARVAVSVLLAIASPLAGQQEVDIASWSAWLAERGVTLQDFGLTAPDLAERARVGFGVHAVKDVDESATFFALGLEPSDSEDERIKNARQAAAKQRARATLLKACFWAQVASDWRYPALVERQLALSGHVATEVEAKIRQGGLQGVLLIAPVGAVQLHEDSVSAMKIAYERALLAKARNTLPALVEVSDLLAEYHARQGAESAANPLDGHFALASGSKSSAVDIFTACMDLRHSARADEDWLLDLAELAYLVGDSTAMSDLMRQVAEMRYQVVRR